MEALKGSVGVGVGRWVRGRSLLCSFHRLWRSGLLSFWPNGTGVERLCFGFLLPGHGREELAPSGAPAGHFCSAGDNAKGKVGERNPTEVGAGDMALNPIPLQAGTRDISAQKSLLFKGRVRGEKRGRRQQS